MPPRSTPADLFTQFFPFEAVLDAADSSVLVEESKNTGLSIRSTFLWLIHAIEWLPAFNEPTSVLLQVALSKLKGESTIPNCVDAGCVAQAGTLSGVATEGAITQWVPYVQRFLPPMPYAAPNLSLYVKTSINSVNWRGKAVRCRLHYTTIPLDSAVYVEIAETWAFT